MDSPFTQTSALRIAVLGALAAVALSGCGGSKVLRKPEPLAVTPSLAAASDQRLAATLDWVIVRDGPGAWAKNVDWDEYLIRVQNLSDEPIRVTNITVSDSLGTRIDIGRNRRQLVEGTKQTKRRYKDERLKVKAGVSAGLLMATGGVSAAAAAAVGMSAVVGYSSAASLSSALVTGTIVAPALVIGGFVRGVNNSKVNRRIQSRQTRLPAVLREDEEKSLDIFFPLAPSPRQIELTYIDSKGHHIVVIDTRTALDRLHLEPAGK